MLPCLNRLEVDLDLFKRFNSLSPGGIKLFKKNILLLATLIAVHSEGPGVEAGLH